LTGLPKRKPNRLKGYDYGQSGAYFITICTKDHVRTLCKGDFPQQYSERGSRPRFELTPLGKCVEESISRQNRDNSKIDRYVIMPNHIHVIITIAIEKGGQKQPTAHQVVRNIKSYTSKWAGFSPWQKSFHDHIIRNEQDYLRIAEYIENNPVIWESDCFYTDQ